MLGVLAVTLGEPAGIGPDITISAWAKRELLSLPPFYVIGDAELLHDRARRLGIVAPIAKVEPEEAARTFGTHLPVVALPQKITAVPGKPDASSAPAAIASIRLAVEHTIAGRASAVVTNPVSKAVLYDGGFSDPGHTEYLARLAHEFTGTRAHPVMMLWAPELAVVPVTVHLPLRLAIERLTSDLIVETGRIVERELRQRFGLDKPRLVAAGLNPHAGEGGALGAEDEAVVAPAIGQLRALGVDIRGPLPADTLFHEAARKTYDAALCMYHDQALIPIKTIAFDHAVNVTLGLPFVRTSPDHGTAFDLAGTGRARDTSLAAALRLAARLGVRSREATPAA